MWWFSLDNAQIQYAYRRSCLDVIGNDFFREVLNLTRPYSRVRETVRASANIVYFAIAYYLLGRAMTEFSLVG